MLGIYIKYLPKGLKTFSHVLPAMLEEAAEKLDELLTPIDVGEALEHSTELATSQPLQVGEME